MLPLSASGQFFGLIWSIHIVLSCEDIDSISSCVVNKPCVTALASLNSIRLKCLKDPQGTKVSWQYLDLSEPHSQPVIFISDEGPIRNSISAKALELRLKSNLVDGNLKINNPTADNTGIYTCKAEGQTLAYYEIDFQDVEQIHISYSDLGEKVQENVSVPLKDQNTAQMFTLWSEWQPCNHCGRQGERKRVGFCYAEVTKGTKIVGHLLPCGLQRFRFKQIPLSRGPELRIETCNINCSELEPLKENADEVPIFVQDSYRAYYHANVKLTCPRSSIYRPIYWKEGTEPLTRLELRKRNGSHVLDTITGGGTLFISYVGFSDIGIYKCYVNNKLVGMFRLGLFSTAQHQGQDEAYGFIESVVIASGLFLLLLTLLSILQACHRIRR